MKNITVIGSGAYGTALANVLLDNNHEVIILGVDKKEIDDININHKNSKYFPDFKFTRKLHATLNWNEALENAEVVVIAVPSSSILDVCSKINKYSKHKLIIINAAKGFGKNSLEIPYELISSNLKQHNIEFIGGIYGPSIANEVLQKESILLVAASNNLNNANQIKEIFKNNYFIVYSSENIKNIEYSVILKNIYAILIGMANALFKSKSSISSFIAISIAEIRQIIGIYTNSRTVMFEISALADIILTTTSEKSRNFSLGYKIGTADDSLKIIKENLFTTEGLIACKILCETLNNSGHNLLLLNVLYNILFNNKKPSVFLPSIFNKLKL